VAETVGRHITREQKDFALAVAARVGRGGEEFDRVFRHRLALQEDRDIGLLAVGECGDDREILQIVRAGVTIVVRIRIVRRDAVVAEVNAEFVVVKDRVSLDAVVGGSAGADFDGDAVVLVVRDRISCARRYTADGVAARADGECRTHVAERGAGACDADQVPRDRVPSTGAT
jgi:hypothetical protein